MRYEAALLAIGASIAGLLTASCTSIDASAVPTDGSASPNGFTYYLAQKTFTIKVDHELMQCDLVEDGNMLAFEVKQTATVMSEITKDVANSFVIDYSDLAAWTKVTTVDIQNYENGTLKSINLAADDRTGTMLTNFTTGAAKIALGFAKLPLDIFSLDEPRRQYCAPRAITGLNLKAKLDGDLRAEKAKDKKIASARAEVAAAEAANKQAKKNLLDAYSTGSPDVIAAAENAVQRTDRHIEQVRASLAQLGTSKTPQLKKELADVVTEYLRKSRTYTITPRPADKLADVTLALPLGEEREWISARGACLINTKDMQTCTNDERARDLQAQISFRDIGMDDASPEFAQTTDGKGIVYRQAADVLVLICSNECGAQHDGVASEGELYREVHSVPQLGVLARLPLENGMFANNTLKVAFSPEGVLTSLTFTSQAQAERAAVAFSEVGATLDNAIVDYIKFLDERRDVAVGDETAALELERSRLEYQAAALDYLKKRQETLGQIERSPLERRLGQIEDRQRLIDAQLELERSQRALKEFRDGAAGGGS